MKARRKENMTILDALNEVKKKLGDDVVVKYKGAMVKLDDVIAHERKYAKKRLNVSASLSYNMKNNKAFAISKYNKKRDELEIPCMYSGCAIQSVKDVDAKIKEA